jgi:hypothetical protein
VQPGGGLALLQALRQDSSPRIGETWLCLEKVFARWWAGKGRRAETTQMAPDGGDTARSDDGAMSPWALVSRKIRRVGPV